MQQQPTMFVTNKVCLTSNNFDSAAQVLAGLSVDGNTYSVTVTNLSPGTVYRFAVKAFDEAGNASYMSGVASGPDRYWTRPQRHPMPSPTFAFNWQKKDESWFQRGPSPLPHSICPISGRNTSSMAPTAVVGQPSRLRPKTSTRFELVSRKKVTSTLCTSPLHRVFITFSRNLSLRGVSWFGLVVPLGKRSPAFDNYTHGDASQKLWWSI